MSLLADIVNAPTEITFRGITYPMRDLTALECAMHSRWLEKRAFDAVARQTQLPDDVRDRMERGILIAAAAGTFEVGSAAYIESTQTIHGWASILSIALRTTHPEATFDFCVEMVTELVANNIRADLEKIQKAVDDPGNSLGRVDSSPARPTSSESSVTTPITVDSVYP